MKNYKAELTEELKGFFGTEDIVSHEGFPVKTFSELQEQMARLSCLNKSSVLYYRGQKADYKADGSQKSSFYPTIYRGRLTPDEKEIRWHQLEYASKKLVDYLMKANLKSSLNLIQRKSLLQWSILQHYEVVPTPLIDVTQSLRVACSFALMDNPVGEGEDCAYVYAFALPYVNHRISIDSEEYLTTIRLLSVAPPEARRPYHQEGFLIGEDFIQKDYVKKEELDLNNRLVAKFKIPKADSFWNIESKLDKDMLYPKNDVVEVVCDSIREEVHRVFTHSGKHDISTYISTPEFMSFISHWITIENVLRTVRGKQKDSMIPISNIIKESPLSESLIKRLQSTNRVRNIVIHDPTMFKPYMADIMRDVANLEYDLKTECKW